jgi:hypothetical protein
LLQPETNSTVPDVAENVDLSDTPARASVNPLQPLHDDLAAMRGDLERIAAHLIPLLSDRHRATEDRARQLEQRLQSRQERPVAVRLGELLVHLQRVTEPAHARTLALESVEDILHQLGYEQFGEIGLEYDERLHEAVEGTTGANGTVVVKVHANGLMSFGDIIVRARVTTGPRMNIEGEGQ